MTKKSPIGETVNQTEMSEIDVLKAQIAELKELVLLSASKQEEPKASNTSKPKKERVTPVRLAKQEKSKELAPNTYVNVMSLVGNKLNLSTKAREPRTTFSFEKFGTVKRMFYSQLLEVIENHPNFFEKGYFYVLDHEVIDANNWNDLYSKLLTKEMIESVVNNSSNAIDLFTGAGEGQKEVIINFLIEKIISGQAIDFNLIAKLNNMENIDINKMAQDRKEANQPLPPPVQK
jgi:hypothetical protein